MFDFIGDVHGHADKLEELLGKLGYQHQGKSYAHPTRKAFFVGDYIDRGPKIRETLTIVRAMVDSGNAVALLGNHEYNALCFHIQETNRGGHLRKHLIKNIIQHYETLRQFQNRQEEYEGWLDWFKTLPLFHESTYFRAVHACWEGKSVEVLKELMPENKLTDDLIRESAVKDSPLNNAIDIILKGKEIKLPAGQFFKDKDGAIRNETRIKWWEDYLNTTYRQISIEPHEELFEEPIDETLMKGFKWYQADNIPVFFGHYWLQGNPMLYKENICCVDYSVAKQGYLAAYRFDCESKLEADKFVYV